MLVIRNEVVWRQCITLGHAIASTSPLLALWFYVLFLVAAWSLVLLNGQFETKKYGQDVQFQDFYHSLVTILVYMIGGNFAYVVEPALDVSGLYIFYFVGLSFTCMFFVTAILVTIFIAHSKFGQGFAFPICSHKTPSQRPSQRHRPPGFASCKCCKSVAA